MTSPEKPFTDEEPLTEADLGDRLRAVARCLVSQLQRCPANEALSRMLNQVLKRLAE